MQITFTKRAEANDTWMDNKNNHDCSQWTILADGVECGFIVGKPGNFSRSASWVAHLFGADIETREQILVGRALLGWSYGTLREVKAALVKEWGS